MVFRKRRAFARKPLRRKTGRKTGKPTAKMVRSIVKTELHKAVENKFVQYASVNNYIASYPDLAGGLLAIALTPNSSTLPISQGVTTNSRVGNVINTRKCVLKYVLRATQYDATYNPNPRPYYVKMWFGHYKPTLTTSAAGYTAFFEQNASSGAPTGYLTDLMAVVNDTLFKVYTTRTVKIGFANYAGTGANNSLQYSANNDFSRAIYGSIDVTRYMSKVFKFNDTVTSPTSGNQMFCWATCCNADGVLVGNLRPLAMDVTVDYTYEDA